MNTNQRRRLHAARELIEVAITAACLEALDTALRLEHPTLEQSTEFREPTTLRRARRVTRLVRALRRALDAYRISVDRTLANGWTNDDLPF